MANNVHFTCCKEVYGKAGNGSCELVKTPERVSGKVKRDFKEIMRINRTLFDSSGKERRKNEN